MVTHTETCILVVDDDADLRETLASDLEQLGYHVEQAANGSEALCLVEVCPVDVVVTDVRMPILGGLDLIRALRLIQPETPAIVMSGEMRWSEALTEVEATAWLDKPFSFERLVATVRELTHE